MLPDQPGTYVLILELCRHSMIAVGKLGTFDFPAGWYTYAGSARGPGGLAARVSRHERAAKTLHWHIDYLRAQADLIAIWYATGLRERECTWAQALSQLPGASLPVSRFGASDCRCPAHLIHFSSQPHVKPFADLVEAPVRDISFRHRSRSAT